MGGFIHIRDLPFPVLLIASSTSILKISRSVFVPLSLEPSRLSSPSTLSYVVIG